jgi:hypothetical protein
MSSDSTPEIILAVLALLPVLLACLFWLFDKKGWSISKLLPPALGLTSTVIVIWVTYVSMLQSIANKEKLERDTQATATNYTFSVVQKRNELIQKILTSEGCDFGFEWSELWKKSVDGTCKRYDASVYWAVTQMVEDYINSRELTSLPDSPCIGFILQFVTSKNLMEVLGTMQSCFDLYTIALIRALHEKVQLYTDKTDPTHWKSDKDVESFCNEFVLGDEFSRILHLASKPSFTES